MTAVEPPVVELMIEGRVTESAIASFAAALRTALDQHEFFVVVFDRTRMTAPTAPGRAALIEMAETLMPRLDGRCLAWADVYDTRRYTSIANAGEHDTGRAYPQRTWDDINSARAWVLTTTTILPDGDVAGGAMLLPNARN
ncbi:hypothetical protein [Micromonospora sp. NPDC005324]|uniref:hypothetical protein n=1 Tax=Micromonospora sp. NPDC005324 TaxID=3157033 RepID=UPI0033AF04AE